MFYEHLNEAIYGTLAKEWGFVEERFVPRRLVQELRSRILSHFPNVLKLNEVHSDTINSVFKKEGLDQAYFDAKFPVYSARITDTGTIRVYKDEGFEEKNGKFRVYQGSTDAFLSSVLHSDWKLDITSDAFQFDRSLLAHLPNSIAYLD